MKRHQFTMLELIIVIAVIVIIVGILMPTSHRPREKSRRVNCAGNLKQIGLALLMYSGENSGYFVLPANGSNFEPLNTETILNDGKVYGCPSADNLMTTARRSNYDYGGSGIKDDNALPTSTTIARDQSGNHPDNQWMNALFVDGHVEGSKPDGSKVWNTYSRQEGAAQ